MPSSDAIAVPQKIATCLWFDGRAREAAEFCASIFAGLYLHLVAVSALP